MKAQGTLPRPATSLHVHHLHLQIFRKCVKRRRGDEGNYRVTGNPLQPITKLSCEQERLDHMYEEVLNHRSPPVRLGPADISITGSSHEALTRRPRASVEADRTERILPCCMVIPIITRCSPSTHAPRRYGGIKLGDEGYINHGMLTPPSQLRSRLIGSIGPVSSCATAMGNRCPVQTPDFS